MLGKIIDTITGDYTHVEQELTFIDEEVAGVTLQIVGYRQTKSYNCGFVAGLMVLHTFYPRASENKFLNLVNPHEEFGTTTNRLANALRASGVVVKLKKGLNFSKIKKHLDAGEPIITTIKHSKGVEHWIVVYGYSEKPNHIYIAGNGFFKKSVFTWEEFKKELPKNGDWLITHG